MKEYDTLVAKAVQDNPFAFLDNMIGEKARKQHIEDVDITLVREAGRVIASLFTEKRPWHPDPFQNRDRSYDTLVSSAIQKDPFAFLDLVIETGKKEHLEYGDEFVFLESITLIASLFTKKQPWHPVPEVNA